MALAISPAPPADMMVVYGASTGSHITSYCAFSIILLEDCTFVVSTVVVVVVVVVAAAVVIGVVRICKFHALFECYTMSSIQGM